jgi:hypothetical protein
MITNVQSANSNDLMSLAGRVMGGGNSSPPPKQQPAPQNLGPSP